MIYTFLRTFTRHFGESCRVIFLRLLCAVFGHETYLYEYFVNNEEETYEVVLRCRRCENYEERVYPYGNE